MIGTSSSIQLRMTQYHARFSLIEALVELIARGWKSVALKMSEIARARRNARARHELQALSDHFLKDLGLERGQIDRMFR